MLGLLTKSADPFGEKQSFHQEFEQVSTTRLVLLHSELQFRRFRCPFCETRHTAGPENGKVERVASADFIGLFGDWTGG